MSTTSVQFIDDYFPLVVCVSPSVYDETELRRLFDGYRAYFDRGERYALVSHSPKGGSEVSARARKAITDWANSPEVRRKSGELCVGSSTVVPNAVTRGVMTALLWVWKPSTEHHIAPNSDEAVDWCMGRLAAAGVPMRSPERLRAAVLERLRGI